jgi:Family of unknown function (DUF6339)
MVAQLKYLSDKALAHLRHETGNNLSRYRTDGFQDFANDPGWDIGLGIEFDDEHLSQLDGSTPRVIAPIDLANSKIVGEALERLTPSLANEERILVRLSHVNAFDYARGRWLVSTNDDTLQNLIEKHFFASTQTGIRDDHALSRLWWNYHIAKTCSPDNIDSALELILKTADIRSNFVERIWMTSRRSIASAVLNAMQSDSWITNAEKNFREFMKSLNKLGGGIVFEALARSDIEAFVRDCVTHARRQSSV